MKRVRLKSRETLEKEGKVLYRSEVDKTYILTDGKEVFKHFDANCFKKIYTVAETEKVISLETFNELKDLFEVIKD